MEKTNGVVSRLENRFTALTGNANVFGERRIFLDVPLESLTEILRYCNDELGFTRLCTITGLDNGETFEFLYHITQEDGLVLTLKVKTPRDNGVLPSVIPIYNGALFYELELEGLLGVTVEGLPADRQYPLPDNWPKGEYPMRKDWKPKAETPPLANP
jgi:membrane-bound hydrogenase subunit beta